MKDEVWKRLQPLRIPPGWKMMWSKLECQEPETLDPEDRAWLFTYVEDMVYLVREGRTQTLALDLGWYPDGDPQGAYRLEAILDNNWNDPLLSLTTRSTREVTETMERWLFSYFPACGPVHEASFRKQHPNRL